MGDHQKKAFAKSLVTKYYSAKEFKKYVKNAKVAKEEDKSDDDANITRFPSIAVLNAEVGSAPLLPVKLEGNLASSA